VIYLVRHGETVWNAQGRRRGQSDSPLTQRGLAQARRASCRLKRALAGAPVRLYSSPLGRAQKTAAIIAEVLARDPANVTVDPLLLEQSYGSWEGLTKHDIDVRYPGARRARRADPWIYIVPDGESYASLYRRAYAWLAKIPEDALVVAVVHEKLSRVLVGAYAGLEPEAMLALRHSHETILQLTEGRVEELMP
jgi:probable phosphoglycerate mutase